MKNLPNTENLILEYSHGWLDIWFNSIENRNALSDGLITDLFRVFGSINNNRKIRGITLRGKGNVFCAGADLKAIKKISEEGPDAKDMAFKISLTYGNLFKVINQAPQVIVSVTEGYALAGGFGIACASDLIITMPDTKFALSETRIGLTPSQISPYMINRLGYSNARKMMLIGLKITGKEAMEIGIVDYLANDNRNLEDILNNIKEQVLRCSPNSIAITKNILTSKNQYLDPEKAAHFFRDCIVSEEGKEGIKSFFDNRYPKWVPDKFIKK